MDSTFIRLDEDWHARPERSALALARDGKDIVLTFELEGPGAGRGQLRFAYVEWYRRAPLTEGMSRSAPARLATGLAALGTRRLAMAPEGARAPWPLHGALVLPPVTRGGGASLSMPPMN